MNVLIDPSGEVRTPIFEIPDTQLIVPCRSGRDPTREFERRSCYPLAGDDLGLCSAASTSLGEAISLRCLLGPPGDLDPVDRPADTDAQASFVALEEGLSYVYVK